MKIPGKTTTASRRMLAMIFDPRSNAVCSTARNIRRMMSSSSSSDFYELTPVQSTSLLVAYWRDLETRHSSDPLIHDPHAQALLDAFLHSDQRKDYETSPIRPYGWELLALRTRLLDDWLLQQEQEQEQGTNSSDNNDSNNHQHHHRQLVNLGAGMCCRPYRLEALRKSKTKVWEIDSDLDLLAKKRGVLQMAGYETHLLVIDASADLGCTNNKKSEIHHNSNSLTQILHSTGFESNRATDWLAEGLFAYLTPPQHANVLEETAALSAPGSRMAVTVAEPAMHDFWESLGVKLPYQELVSADSVLEQAASFGWSVDKHVRPDDWSKLYPGRGEHLPGYHLVFLQKEKLC